MVYPPLELPAPYKKREKIGVKLKTNNFRGQIFELRNERIINNLM